MKKRILPALLLSAAMFAVACDESGELPSAITIPGSQNMSPTFFADGTGTVNTVSFTTDKAWSSTVTEKTASQTRAAADWLTISPDHADEGGSFDVTISLQTNTTGEDRSAVVTIICGDDKANITVTQKATKEDGTKPQPEQSGGQGGFNCTFATVGIVVDGARQTISQMSSVVTKVSVSFYQKDTSQDEAFYLDFHISPSATILPIGSYSYSATPISTQNTFYNKGGTIGTKAYTVTGGAVDVRKNGDTYMIEVDIAVIDANNNQGKITGNYSGYIPGGSKPVETEAITVETPEHLAQNLWADATSGSAVTFITNGTWTSAIKGTTSTDTPKWITVSPDSGVAAGKYFMNLQTEVNRTGADRTAVITISCNGKTVNITVTQKRVTANNTVPGGDEENGNSGSFTFTAGMGTLYVDGARQTVSATSTGRKATITFIKDGAPLTQELSIDVYLPATVISIPTGNYPFSTDKTVGTSNFDLGIINGYQCIPTGGSIDITLNGDKYAMKLDFEAKDANGDSGKLYGEYNGTMPVVN